jgi:hypothetical protein
MTTFLNSTAFSIRAGVLLVAFVAALASANRAIAGCGDHVIVLKPAGSPPTLANSPIPKTPCRGPGCSAQPSKPVIPPMSVPVTTNIIVKDVASVIDSDRDMIPAGIRFFADEQLLELDRIPTSIFHPPRV